MKNEKLQSSFTENEIPFKTDFDITNKSTMKIHSKTEFFVTPLNFSQLQKSIELCSAQKIPYFILGGGSNTIFPDDIFHGAIISTEKLNKIEITCENPVQLTCSAGTPMANLVNFCTQNSLTGLEEFAGLPGTVGGALYMNARCFEKSICENLYQTEHLLLDDENLQIIKKNYDKSEWDYKKSPFQNKTVTNGKKIILSATFSLKKVPTEEIPQIQQKCKYYINERVSKGHFKFPSAGSVFKNNRNFGKPSGKLIDETGIKGTTCGGAQIAPFHANFIINTGNATAADIKNLIKIAQEKVHNQFNFNLEPEILFLE